MTVTTRKASKQRTAVSAYLDGQTTFGSAR